jgi:small Trp-rich protein
MYLLWIGAVAVLLKWFEVGPVAGLSWWWVLAPLAAAVVWFEWLERVFGFDRKQVEASDWEKRRKERIASQWDRKEPRR